MTFNKLAAAALLAASTFGAAGIAQAQTAPNDTSAQAKPSEKPAVAGQPMTQPTTVAKPGAPMPPPAPNDTSAQAHPGEKPGMDHPPKKKHMGHKPMPAPANGQPMGSPDSGTPYSPATATDNTTVPAPAKTK